MPSRMSDSLTSIDRPTRRATRSATRAPPVITSARPGCIDAQASDLVDGHRRQPVQQPGQLVDRQRWRRAPGPGRTPASSRTRRRPAWSRCRPPRSRCRSRRVDRRSPSSSPSTYAVAAARACGGVGLTLRNRSVSRTEPMSSDAACSIASRRDPGSARSSRRRCPSPAPEPSSAIRTPLSAPAKDSRASSAPVITSGVDAEPVTGSPAKNSSTVAGVPGRRGGDELDPLRRPRRRPGSPRRTARPRRRSGRARRGGTRRWRRRPGRAGRSPSRRSSSSSPPSGAGSAISSRIELVPQSIAATGAAHRCRPPGTADVQNGADQLQGHVADRVHPGTGRQRVTDQRVQALHPVRHPAGADPGDLRHLAEPAPGPAQVGPVGGGVARPPAPDPRRSRSVISVISPDASSVEHAATARRAGQVEGRRERRTVRPAGAGWPPRRAGRTGSGTRPRRRPRGGGRSCAVTAASSARSVRTVRSRTARSASTQASGSDAAQRGADEVGVVDVSSR